MHLAAASIMQQWFEGLWNDNDESTIERLMHADAVVHGLGGPVTGKIVGPADFMTFYRTFRTTFPDIHIEIVHAVTEGDLTVAHCRVTGTHQGDGLGMAPTGRRVDFYGFALGRVREGRMVEAWNCFDFLSLYQQLGVPMQLPSAD